jgi:hypothetical protein
MYREIFMRLRFLGSDDMFTAFQGEGRGLASDDPSTAVLPIREALVVRLIQIEAHFLQAGWPSLRQRVVVSPDDVNAWAEMPEDWEQTLNAQGRPPELQVPGQYELITRRVEPLSADYWLIGQARRLRQVLDAADKDGAIQAAVDLGTWTEQGRLHALHLPAVRKRRLQARPLRETSDASKVAASIWRRAACTAAQKMWDRNPALSANAVAKRVRVDLLKLDPLSSRGKAPSERSIRRVIGTLRPSRTK